MPITVRQIESMIRIAEAHARMHLRDNVIEDDVNLAVRVILESFISTQKLSAQKYMRRKFAHYLTYLRDANELLLNLLQQMVSQQIRFDRVQHGDTPPFVEIDKKEFEERAQQMGLSDVGTFINSEAFRRENYECIDTGDRSVIRRRF